jgi:hypothetical protein
MNMKPSAVCVTFGLLLASPSLAGQIADTFRDGIFGLPWGAPAQEIEAKLPGGKWTELPGGARFYTVRDGRKILDIERKPKNELTLGLSKDGRLQSVSITFPTDSDTIVGLRVRAEEEFGPSELQRQQSDSGGPVVSSFVNTWPVDEGIKISINNSVAGLSTMAILTVQNTNIRGDLPSGFQ